MSLEIIQKIREKGITQEQRTDIYSITSHVSKETREEVCPALFHVLLNSDVSMKNELGRVIFHLQKNDRLETAIGLQKLVDASLIAAPEDMFKILEDSGEEAKELSKKIKSVF